MWNGGIAVSTIIAARFSTFVEADKVDQVLLRSGFPECDITNFFVNPAGQHNIYPIGGDKFSDRGTRKSHKGAIVAAMLGAVAGAILGGLLLAIFAVPSILVIGLSLVGAYGGSLLGALSATRDAPQTRKDAWWSPGQTRRIIRPEDAHPSGVMVAVRVTPGRAELARRLLSENGGQDVEQAEGEWRNGTWTDFDPLKVPRASPPTA